VSGAAAVAAAVGDASKRRRLLGSSAAAAPRSDGGSCGAANQHEGDEAAAQARVRRFLEAFAALPLPALDQDHAGAGTEHGGCNDGVSMGAEAAAALNNEGHAGGAAGQESGGWADAAKAAAGLLADLERDAACSPALAALLMSCGGAGNVVGSPAPS
jgi:hypothetical protein